MRWETYVLIENKEWLSKEFDCEVFIRSADDLDIPEHHKKKAQRAEPLKPAIYLE